MKGTLTRTRFELKAVVGLPDSRWRGEAFVVEPFECPKEFTKKLGQSNRKSSGIVQTNHHPIWQAMAWAERMAETPGLTISQIAEEEGFSASRARQISRLMRLMPEIRKFLCGLTDGCEARFFNEKKLRRLTKLEAKDQRREFEKLKLKWEASLPPKKEG